LYLVLAQTNTQISSGTAAVVLVVALIISLIMGTITGKIGESAGHNFWLFFALGFFLGIIGLIITIVVYFISRDSHKRRQAYYPPPDSFYPPPDSFFPAAPIMPPPPVPPPDHAYQQGVVACPQCKSAVPKTEQFCWNCGNAVMQPRPSAKVCSLCQTRETLLDTSLQALQMVVPGRHLLMRALFLLLLTNTLK